MPFSTQGVTGMCCCRPHFQDSHSRIPRFSLWLFAVLLTLLAALLSPLRNLLPPCACSHLAELARLSSLCLTVPHVLMHTQQFAMDGPLHHT